MSGFGSPRALRALVCLPIVVPIRPTFPRITTARMFSRRGGPSGLAMHSGAPERPVCRPSPGGNGMARPGPPAGVRRFSQPRFCQNARRPCVKHRLPAGGPALSLDRQRPGPLPLRMFHAAARGFSGPGWPRCSERYVFRPADAQSTMRPSLWTFFWDISRVAGRAGACLLAWRGLACITRRVSVFARNGTFFGFADPGTCRPEPSGGVRCPSREQPATQHRRG